MLDFVKNIAIDDKINERLVMDTSNFVEIDQYEPNGAFPEVFDKGQKFDCILADLGINT